MRLYLSADLSKSHKLQGNLEFMGLPIAVENRKGSSRHWHDPHSGERGSTKMLHPYGYVKGTLGVDGDEVDVYVGPNKSSQKVFIVTQMRKPDFTEVDEQKVMLGFTSSSEAKEAYLAHYDDPKFFGSIKEFTMDEFKEKLASRKGELIKNLFHAPASANMPTLSKTILRYEDMSARVRARQKEHEMTTEKSCDHSKSTTCENCEDASGILKGLTSRMLSLTKRAVERIQAHAPAAADPEFATQEVTLFGPQIAQALHVNRPFEPPSVPVVQIATPPQSASPLAPDFMTSCGGCGYTHKSLSSCPRCATNASSNREAAPIWRR